MNQLNSIILEGNVVRQAEFSEPVEGFKKCSFSLAVNRFNKNAKGDAYEEVSFFDVEAYGKMAEVCDKNVTRGRGTRVVGRLKQDRWKDSDGKNKSKIYVVAEHVEFKPKVQKSEDGDTVKSEDEKSDDQSGSETFEQASEESVF